VTHSYGDRTGVRYLPNYLKVLGSTLRARGVIEALGFTESGTLAT